MALRDLIAKLTFKVDATALDQLDKNLDKSKKKLHELDEEKLEGLKSGLEAIKERLDLIVGYEMLKGLYELSERMAKIGLEIGVASRVTGLGVEQFQEMAFVAKGSAVSQDQLMTSLQRLSRTLYEAKTGSTEAQQSLARLGFQPGQTANIHNAGDAMMMLATRMQNMHDPMQKMALAQKVLGRSSREMIDFLSKGPEAIQKQMSAAREEGLVLSGHQVESLEHLAHSFEKLEQFVKVVSATFAEMFAPVVEHLVDDFVKFYNANKDLINLNVTNFLKHTAYVLGWLDGFITTFTENMRKRFGKSGWSGHILEVVAALGSLVTAILAVSTVMAGVKFIASFTGIASVLGRVAGSLGSIARFAGPALGLAGRAALGLGSTLGGLATTAGGAIASGASAVGGAAVAAAPVAGAVGLGVAGGFGLMKLLDAMTGGGYSRFISKPADLLYDFTHGGAQSAPQNVTVQQVINPSPGMNERDLGKHAADHVKMAMQQAQRETLRGVQGTRVGVGP